MARPRNVGREIALILGAAALFAIGLVSYLLHEIPGREELEREAQVHAGASAAPDPALTRDLDTAADVLSRFTQHLAGGRYADAYALMASPYQQTASLEAFSAACRASPFLAGVQKSALLRTSRIAVPGGSYTMQGRGMLVANAGSIDANVTFMVDGSDVRILVLSLAGVPVLDGISGKR